MRACKAERGGRGDVFASTTTPTTRLTTTPFATHPSPSHSPVPLPSPPSQVPLLPKQGMSPTSHHPSHPLNPPPPPPGPPPPQAGHVPHLIPPPHHSPPLTPTHPTSPPPSQVPLLPKQGMSPSGTLRMLRYCTREVAACFANPSCRQALDELQRVGLNDQVGAYR